MSRIYQYPVVTEISNDDYLALGSAVNGSRSILASDLAPVIGNKTITERGTYKASDDNMDGYGQVTVDIPYTDIHVASGDIATFEGEDLPLKSLKVAVTPYQDLHGQDAPWAGGAGKNIFGIKEWLDANEITYTQNGNSYTFNLDNKLYSYKWEFSDTDIATNLKATITIPSGSTASNVGFVLYNQSGTAVTGRVNEYSNKTGCKIGLDWSSLGQVTITEAIITKSTDSVTPFAPYSNICPIIGWDEAVVTRCGINLFDVSKVVDLALGSMIVQNDNYRGWYMPVHNGETFTISRKNISAPNRFRMCFTTELPANGILYYNDKGSERFYIDGDNLTQITVTVPNDKTYRYIFIYLSNANETITEAMEIQVEFGTTATTYSPYNGATYTIDLNGTRYGGTLDATNGTMTVDRVSVVFDGSNDENWLADADGTSSDGFVCFRAYLQNNNIKKPEGTISTMNYIGKMFSSTMPTLKNGYVNQYPMANTVMGITGYSGSSNNYFYLNVNKTLSNIQSVAELRAWLAENPTTVCYELATPITVQLAPTPVKSLEGTNNIFANCGAVDVEYQTVWVRPSN